VITASADATSEVLPIIPIHRRIVIKSDSSYDYGPRVKRRPIFSLDMAPPGDFLHDELGSFHFFVSGARSS